MYVYIGFEVYYDYCNQYETVAKVFDDEVKALVWVDEIKHTDTEWRTYRKVLVE
jgi:hypothetical protein